jgi:hypothetical protein
MSNHLHLVVYVNPGIVQGWSDREVLERWYRVFPHQLRMATEGNGSTEVFFTKKLEDKEFIQTVRDRLGEISWLMRCLNEHIARKANREDGCSGRFWEGRFKCQRLCDPGAVLTCMAYVDLNPVRAGLADSPEASEFTSAYERIQSEQASHKLEQINQSDVLTAVQMGFVEETRQAIGRADWLMDFERMKANNHLPFLGLTQYLELLDETGRIIRSDKKGSINEALQPILRRLDLDVDEWVENVERYGRLFYQLSGKAESLVAHAHRIGQKFCRGLKGAGVLYARRTC